MAEAEPSQSTWRDTGTNPAAGFGRFRNDLADYLELRVIKKISNLLELKPGKIERITRSETPSHDMVDLLEIREVIAPTGISDLVDMVHELNLPGLADKIQNSFQATKSQSLPLEGFGSFKVALADVLTVAIVLQLATIFDYPPVIKEELGTTVGAGLLMIRYMEERGHIQPTNILELLSALKKICNSGTAERVKKLYEEHTGILCPNDGQSKAQEEDKLEIFTNYLKHTYAMWYNRIQPIPYIREKICCVDDIYVESGLELVHQPTSFKHDSQSFEESGLVSLKSFRDIFDSDIIPYNRILLEGDPGYGKSTLTLQAAYDWCLGNVALPLKNFAVFILLPLRLLGNISSIFEAIRFVLMPKESPLTDDDILEILRHSSSVVIVLDGYDEYPDQNSVIETDIMKMIAGKMFPNVKVVVSTRSSSLPTYLHPTTVTIRLTGFDEKSRDDYIQRTVTGGDQEASRRITNALNSSPILNDICQVPMFCVLFAHVANDQKGVIEFSSVTSFFKYVIDCFYSHMWKKDHKEPIHQSIREYSKLNRLAFDGLTAKTQMIAWPKHTFIDTVGKDCYEELSYIGIIIVDKTNEIINEPGEYDIHHIRQSELVRFYHKLFAEWYAARYLSSYAGSFWPFWLEYNLNKINPVDLQFVFRFACGLNKKASSRIIKYLKSVEEGASFASLCLFEQPGNPKEVVETVKGLCSDGMIIRSSDSRLLQRSNIQLLEIASRKKIAVPCLQIDHSFKLAHQHEITLESGLSVPVLLSIEKLVLTTQAEHEMSQENMLRVFRYGQQCLQLKTITFHGKFVLPLSLTVETLISNMNSRNITVFWQLLEYVFHLDVSSGKWRLSSTESLTSGIVEPGEDVKMLRSVCSCGMTLQRTDSRLLQRAKIQLLEIASRHRIRVSCLQIDHSFKVAHQNEIALESGLSVPVLSSIEKLVFTTQTEHEISQENMLEMVKYGQRCLQLKTLAFHGKFVLPLSLTVETLKSNMNSRSITVFWQLLEYVFQLDVSSGKWRLSSVESLTSGMVEPEEDVEMLRNVCSGDTALRRTDSRLLQRAKIQLIEIASRHKIGESCLHIDHSFKLAHQKEVTLESGLIVPILSSTEKLVFTTQVEHEISQENMLGVVKYGQRCLQLKTLAFHGKFVLPLSLTVETLKSNMNSRNIIVFWQLLEYVFQLDVSSGKWRLGSNDSLTSSIVEPEEDVEMLRSVCSGDMALRCTDNRLLQRASILFLDNASRNMIQLSCLVLDTFREADQHSITLENGNQVPVLSTLEEMQIRTEKRTEFTQEQVVGLLCYAQQCHQLQKISFIDCLVPLCFSNDSLWPYESDTLKVLWKPGEQEFDLNYTRGRWMLESQEYLTLVTKDQHSLTNMCSGTVTLHKNDTNEYHKSVILLLQIAASQQIEVPCLQLDHSFKVALQNEVTLESGLSVPVLLSIEKLVFTTQSELEISQENMLGVVKYGQRCLQLKTLPFQGKFVLPLSLSVETLQSNMISRNITVFWQLLECVFQLDISSGKWRLSSTESLTSGIVEPKEDFEMLRSVCSSDMALRCTDSRLLQRANIQFLEIASRHMIPLSCLVLDTFREADKHSITLENGNHVPVLSTLKEMLIRTEKRIEFTQEQVVGLLCYAQQCPKLQKISFIDCLVPLCFPKDSLWPCESDTLKVSWKPGEQDFDLNFTRGRWTLVSQEYPTLETKDQHSLTKMCSGTVTLQTSDTKEYHRSVILLLQIAASQQIQITSLMLESFSSADRNHLILQGRHRVPLLPTLKEIQIKTNLGKEFAQDQVIGLICYALQCQLLKKLSFIDCVLPLLLPVGFLSPLMKLNDIEVSWKPSKPDLHLDYSRGKWMLNSMEGITLEAKTQTSLRRLCSSSVFLRGTDSKQLQMSTILLLEIASSHNIPIHRVTLGWSFSKIDEDGNIILSSGLSLPIITSIERMNIQTEKGREMNKHEVNGILNYLQHSQRLKALFLEDCLQPSPIPVGPSLSTLKSRGVSVFWKPDSDTSGQYFDLDLGSGLWLKDGSW